jgi:hypothetical protein
MANSILGANAFGSGMALWEIIARAIAMYVVFKWVGKQLRQMGRDVSEDLRKHHMRKLARLREEENTRQAKQR